MASVAEMSMLWSAGMVMDWKPIIAGPMARAAAFEAAFAAVLRRRGDLLRLLGTTTRFDDHVTGVTGSAVSEAVTLLAAAGNCVTATAGPMASTLCGGASVTGTGGSGT